MNVKLNICLPGNIFDIIIIHTVLILETYLMSDSRRNFC